MIDAVWNTSEKLVGQDISTALQQLNFKLVLERDAFKNECAKLTKASDGIKDDLLRKEFMVEQYKMKLANAIEIIKKYQLELFGKSSEKAKFLENFCKSKNLFDEAELVHQVEQIQEVMDQSIAEVEAVAESSPAAGTEVAANVPVKKRAKHKKHDLLTLPADTPVVDVDHTVGVVAPLDPNTGRQMHQVGTRTERKVGMRKGLVIYNHIFPVFAPGENYEADSGEDNQIVVYPKVKRIVSGSMVGTEVLAEIMTNKYLDHLPLYRQELIFRRQGFPISRQDMKNWIMDAAEMLAPLVDRLRIYLLQCMTINMDETNHYVRNVDGETIKSDSFEIIQVGTCDDYQVVVYTFNAKKNAQMLSSLLVGFGNFLMTDGLVSYSVAVRDALNGLHCTKGACWAHARRDFVSLVKINPKSVAMTMVNLIRELYSIERDLRGRFAKGELTQEAFVSERLALTTIVFEKIHIWLLNTKNNAMPGGQLEKAVNYCLNRYDELIEYPINFHATPDNNIAERFTRPFSMGAGNWLFSDTDTGAKASSVIFTLLQNARLSGLNEFDYIWDVLDRAPAFTKEEQFDDLLPWRIDLGAVKAKKALVFSARGDPARTKPYVIRGGKY
jgi:transposase